MIIACIITARKNSKRIKNKNLLKLDNLDLVSHSIGQAKKTKKINYIAVTSDSDEILKIAETRGAIAIKRPKRLSSKYSQSEMAIIHAYKFLLRKIKIKIDLIVFLQPTSPLRSEEDITKAINMFLRKKSDSMFSASLFKNHIWQTKGKLRPINYDYKKRTFEQQKKNQINENGSFYIFKPNILLTNLNRLGGKIDYFLMDSYKHLQIDEPIDMELVKAAYKYAKKNK